MAKDSSNLVPGDTFGINGFKKRGHIVTFVQDYKGFGLFFDTLTGEVFTLPYNEIDIASKRYAEHPFRDDILIFDFIENLPEEIFDVVRTQTLTMVPNGVKSGQII